MFPTGMAGAALLVLRVAVAMILIFAAGASGSFVAHFLVFLALVLTVAGLLLGLFTPYCAAISSFIMFYLLASNAGSNWFCGTIAILIGGISATLGPGAYSIDARIFGRKLVTLPPRK